MSEPKRVDGWTYTTETVRQANPGGWDTTIPLRGRMSNQPFVIRLALEDGVPVIKEDRDALFIPLPQPEPGVTDPDTTQLD